MEKGDPPTVLVGMYTVAATVETVWRFLRKPKIELPCDPKIPLLGIYLKKMTVLILKDTYTSMLTAALITIAKIRKHLSVH